MAFRQAQEFLKKKYNGEYKLLDISDVDSKSFNPKIVIAHIDAKLNEEDKELWHKFNKVI